MHRKIFNCFEITRNNDVTRIVVAPVRDLIPECFQAINCRLFLVAEEGFEATLKIKTKATYNIFNLSAV